VIIPNGFASYWSSPVRAAPGSANPKPGPELPTSDAGLDSTRNRDGQRTIREDRPVPTVGRSRVS
jgi:hypothetical protein